MSNIFDALNKQRTHVRESAEPVVPLVPPRPPDLPPAPPVGDPERDLELERLRQRVLQELGPQESVSLTFTAAVDGEGASTMALLFARELARAERKPVLLVDGDLTGSPSSLTGALGGDDVSLPGLSDLLANRADLSACLLATEAPNLHFLPRGTELGSPIDLVKSDAIHALLKRLEQHYGFVIVDAASALFSPETAILGAACDGVVLVVRANRTRREVVQKGLRALRHQHCRMLGAVLNDRKYPIPDFLYRRL